MPKLTFVVLSFGLFGSLACNQIADIHDPIPQGGPATTPATTGSAPGTTASGAPSTPSSTPSSGGDPSNFLGKWSGTGTISYTNCTLSSDNGSVQGGGAMTLTPSSKGFTMVNEGDDCGGEFTVNGSVATGSGPVQCSVTNQEGTPFAVRIDARTFTLTSATTGTLHLTGKVTDTIDNTTCDIEQNGNCSKVSGN
jgi:hypothetical protein